MAVTIVDFNSVTSNVGAAFRAHRDGPERDLVDQFLADLPFSVPRGCHATVFREPRIASGFPDLVIVFWSIATATKWTPERSSLTPDDVRIAHYLYQCGPLPEAGIRSVASRNIRRTLERLEAAEVVRRVRNHWQLRSLSTAFAARRIIAIEAKVSEWGVAINQAFLNTWFASDSFVLVPEGAPVSRLEDVTKPLGVGVRRLGEQIVCNQPAFPHSVPRSYASWLFNEWSWRSLEATGEQNS